MSHLFTIGPVEMFEETLEIGGKQVPYFRNDEFSQTVLSASAGLKRLLFNENGEIILLTCSGTGAMEATIMNCFTKEDNLIVIDGGSFGHRFTQICDVHEILYKAVKVEQGETLTKSMIEEVMNGEKFTGFLVNLDETSIGQLYDIQMISEICKENDLVLVVDAISAFLADEVNMDKYGIDAVILSSQKALSLAPGLSVVALSERMLKRVESIDSKSIYFDYKDYLKNGERGQTPFTPAVRVVIELEEIVKLVGMDALSAPDRLKLEVSRSIREDYLHQNAFMDEDTYTSLNKQFLLMKAILTYYDKSAEALKAGANIERLAALPSRERIGRLKYVAEDAATAEFDAAIKQLEEEIKIAIEKGDD